MAVFKKKRSEIPSDAVLLTQDEALAYEMKIIQNWENKSEVWPLRYTPGILGALSAATGIYINNHYRKKLKLGNYGKLSTYLPIVVLPALMSMLYHRGSIQRAVILNTDACPICTQVRASAFQTGCGVVYPTLISPFAAFMFATRHYTYRLPLITEEPKQVLALARKFTKPLLPFLGGALAIHALLSMFLTYKEIYSCYSLQLKLREMERKIEEEEAM